MAAVPLHRFHGIRFKVKRRLVVGRQSIFFVPTRIRCRDPQSAKHQYFMDMKKVALFDLDGVVIDTEGQYTEFWETIGKRYCPEIPDFALRIKGMALVQILASQASLQAHEKEIRRAIDEFELDMDYPYIAGAREFLCALREAGVPRAVVTSSNRAKMENVYRVHPEFRTLFDQVFTADDITRSKPAPDCYVNAAHCMGVEPAECVVFEDSLNGLKAARAAGTYVVALTTSCTEQEVAPLADRVVDDFADFATGLALFSRVEA